MGPERNVSMKIPKRAALILLGLALLLLVVAAYFRRDIGTAYVASQFRSATDADSELEAARKIREWIHWTRGYRVTAKDAGGTVIKPHETKNYDAVAEILITWDNKTTAERKILNRKSLVYIYGE